MVRDLTKGNPTRLIFAFFIPLTLCNLLQQVYNIADSVIVGHFVNANALAAVGATGSVSTLFLGLLTGACTGSTIPVSNHFGAGQHEQMRKTVANAVYFVLILSALLTAVPLLCLNGILTLMQTPAEILTYAKQYLLFTFIGTICLAFYNLTAALLRAVGDSRTPLISLGIACVVNIVLNIILVKIGLAVIGVALATAIAQLLSACFCIVYIKIRLPMLFPKGKEWRPDAKLFANVCRNGLPMGLQMSVVGVSTIVVQSFMNSLGTVYVAANAIADKVFGLFATGIMESLGVTMVTYCSQNLGARQIDRIRRGERSVWKIMAVLTVLAAVIFIFFGKPLSTLFLNSAEGNRAAILENSAYKLRVLGVCIVPLAFIYVYRNSLQGLGFGAAAMIGGLMELIGRCVIALSFIKPFGFRGIVLASPAAWLLAGLTLFIIYRVQMRKIIRRNAATDPPAV